MPTYKILLKCAEGDKSALTALIQLAVERFQVSSFEQLDADEPKLVDTVLPKPRKSNGHKNRTTVNRVAETTTAGEFLRLAKAAVNRKVSTTVYFARLKKLGYADTTGPVTLNKLARAGYIKREGKVATLLHEYDPNGIDAKLREMISKGKKVA